MNSLIDHQIKSNDCGISAVKTVYNLMKLEIDRNYIQDHIALDEKGSSFVDLKNFFNKHGCKASFKFLDIALYNSEPSQLKELFPFILPIKKNRELHYLVVNGIKNGKLRIYDPSKKNPYYLSFPDLINMAHFERSYWDLVDFQEQIKTLCTEELSRYDMPVNGYLNHNNSPATFNKLVYFTHIRDNYGFKDEKSEKLFLKDLLDNQKISNIPEQYIQLKYEKEKIKLTAPLVLTVVPKPGEKVWAALNGKQPNIYIKLFNQLGNNKRLWYIYLGTALFAALVTQLAVFVNQILIDYVLPSFQLNILILFAIGFALFRVFDLVISQYKRFVAIHVGNILDRYFLVTFNEKLNTFSLKYAQTFKRGDLTERLSDAMKLKRFFVNIFSNIMVESFVSVTSIIILFIFSPTLTLLICGVVIIYVIWFKFITPYLQFNEQKRFIIKANFISRMIERIDGNQVIKSFRLDSTFSNKIHQNIGELIDIQTRTKYIDLANTSVISIISTVAYTLLVIFITRNSIFATQTLSIGEVITFIMLSERVFVTLTRILDENLSLRENEIILKRYFDFNEVQKKPDGEGINKFTIDSIELKNISFGYIPTKPVFTNIDFLIKKGDRIKIEGANGTGKSSLCKLLAFLYSPDSGQILINDRKDIFYNRKALIDKILFLSNEDILFDESLIFNITFDRDIPHSRILDLAKEIDLYDFIAGHDEGLNYAISENGRNLSTGQRKKILIMRALLSNAEVIILDEVLSGIDLTSREKIEARIDSMPDKTFILISHEPVRNLKFDKNLVLSNGSLEYAQY